MFRGRRKAAQWVTKQEAVDRANSLACPIASLISIDVLTAHVAILTLTTNTATLA